MNRISHILNQCCTLLFCLALVAIFSNHYYSADNQDRGNTLGAITQNFSGFGFQERIRASTDPKALDLLNEVSDRTTKMSYMGSLLKADGRYKEEYDTLKRYIELSATEPNSFHEFHALDGAVQFNE